MEKVYTAKETVHESIDTFYLDREGEPELIPFGFSKLDEVLGGLGPQSCAILAGATGVGKSSAMLSAMLSSTVPVGCVSVEDPPDVVGTRLLSAATGINSLRIRRKDLTTEELRAVNGAASAPGMENLHFSYPIAGSLASVEEAVDALCNKGCRMVWLDYLQKVRGHRDQRRDEVGETFTIFQRAVARGGAAGVAVCQLRRLQDAERIPGIHHLKESGDLEIEARVIIMGHKIRDPESADRVRFRVAKSTYGGEDTAWDMVRDKSGTLRGVKTLDWGEGGWDNDGQEQQNQRPQF